MTSEVPPTIAPRIAMAVVVHQWERPGFQSAIT
jgi:hypothetical protein